MSGITGIINLNQKSINQKDIKKMTDAIKHRGPDEEGYFIDNNLGLGHRRLAIIDLSKAGHQPMNNKDGSLWIVHNGEVYNYLELRKELENRGYKFKSSTDTEIILYAYQEWGEKCLEKFNGRWAFAIWDRKKKELFCSRDRIGIKPLYYFFDGKIFAFASEIKPLLKLKNPREPNETLIYDFLRFGLLDHTNETFFKNIKKLPPGSWLKIKQNRRISIRKYWDFEVSNEIRNNKKDSQRDAEEFLELLIDSVKLRLRSDVPIGSCFSGGPDSSAIVCIINNLLRKEKIPVIGERQKTFSAVSKKNYLTKENILRRF